MNRIRMKKYLTKMITKKKMKKSLMKNILEEEEENTVVDDIQGHRRSTRIPKISQRLQTYKESTVRNYSQKNIQFPRILYNDSEVRVVAQMMLQLRDIKCGISQQHVVTYSLKKGIQKFGMEEEQLPKSKCNNYMSVSVWTGQLHFTK